MVLPTYLSGKGRLNRQPGTLGHSLAFYAHDVLLPAFGWHLSWRLQSFAGRNGATVIAAIMLTVIVVAIFVTQPGNRPFVVTATATGFIFPVFSTYLTPNVATYPVVLPDLESGSRYTVLPILLFEAVAVVGVDYLMRHGDLMRLRDGRRRRRGTSLRPAIAASALIAVLASSWVADFRYAGFRSEKNWNWAPIAAKWQHDCVPGQPNSPKRPPSSAGLSPCDRLR